MGQKFQTPTYRPVRVAMYSLLGLSAFVPILHGITDNGWELQDRQQGVSYFIGLGLLNFTGGVIYGLRVPERWYPKRFDIVGSSHQIMHLLVMCGAICYGIGLVRTFDYWQSKNLTREGACGVGFISGANSKQYFQRA